MRKAIWGSMVLLFLFMGCSSATNPESLLRGKWVVDHVVYLKSGQIAPAELTEGTTHLFGSRHDWTCLILNQFIQEEINGTWDLQDSVLRINSDGVITELEIEALEKDQLIWSAHEDEDLEFHLKRSS